jgi:hypothetical protein
MINDYAVIYWFLVLIVLFIYAGYLIYKESKI